MKLLNLYRRKVFVPWLIVSVIFAALFAFLYVLMEGDASVVAILLGGLFLLCFVISTIRALTGWGTKGYRKYMQTLGPGEQEILYDQYKEGFRLNSAVLTENCVIILNMQILDAMPYDKILWIYEEQYNNSNVYASSVRTMAVCTDDKKIHRIPMRAKDNKHLRTFLDRILAQNPGIVLGYDRKVADLYKKNIDQLADQVRQKANAANSDYRNPVFRQTPIKPVIAGEETASALAGVVPETEGDGHADGILPAEHPNSSTGE